jgi:hypothetical protein
VRWTKSHENVIKNELNQIHSDVTSVSRMFNSIDANVKTSVLEVIWIEVLGDDHRNIWKSKDIVTDLIRFCFFVALSTQRNLRSQRNIIFLRLLSTEKTNATSLIFSANHEVASFFYIHQPCEKKLVCAVCQRKTKQRNMRILRIFNQKNDKQVFN